MHPPRLNYRRLRGLLFCLALLATGTNQTVVFGQTARKKPSASPSPATQVSPKADASATLPSAYIVPDVAATVDGSPIHKRELDGAVEALLANQGRTLQSVADADKRRVYRTVLDNAIISRLLAARATTESVADLDVEKQFQELLAQYPDRNAFDAELKKSGQTAQQFKETIRRQIAQQRWVEHQIADQIKVTPQEEEKVYKEGPPSNFDAPEAVRASHILVTVRKDAPPEDALDAENKINDLAARIKKGASFEDVAKASSDDPKSKGNGGDIGWITRGRIMPEFADVAFRLRAGQVSDPVRTPLGYHLIKSTDHRMARTATLDEARGQINADLVAAKRQAAVAGLIQDLRDQAKIEIFLP